MRKMWILKVYRYTRVDDGDGELPKYKRELFDAQTFDEGGMSAPLGPDEEFELYIEPLD